MPALLAKLRARLRPPAYEPDATRIIQERVRPGFVCADVGANIGQLTKVMAESAGSGGRVVAFEPWPDNVERVRAGLKGLLGVVEVEECVISDGASEELWLHEGRNCSDYEWNIMGQTVDGEPTRAERRVRAVSLDQFFLDGDRQPPDFVKIDVEGAEALVLAGMRRLLREVRPVVLVEFHHNEGWEGRHALFDAGYGLLTLTGETIARSDDRVYQCLALPPSD